MVCELLNLTLLQECIEHESQSTLGSTLQGQLELLHSGGFVPVRVHVTPQSAFCSLTTKFEVV